MRTIVEIEQPGPFARVLREQMERMLGYSDALPFVDDLAEVSTPFYFHEFVEHACAPACNSAQRPICSRARCASARQRRAADGQPARGRGRQRAVHGLLQERMFRQTLICHAAAPVDRRIVMLTGCPPPVSGEVSERPRVSPLARAQSLAGLEALSSLLHANVRLDGELEARALALLDGTRTIAEVAAALEASPEQIVKCAERLVSVGLLFG